MEHRYLKGTEEFMTDVTTLTKQISPKHSLCTIRAVVERQRNLLCVIIVGAQKKGGKVVRQYSPFSFLSETFHLSELPARLRAVQERRLSVADRAVEIEPHQQFEAQLVQSGNHFHKWPGWLFSTCCAVSTNLHLRALISSEHRPYRDIADAISDWTGVAVSSSGDSRLGRLLLFVPSFIGRFAHLSFQKRCLHIKVERSRGHLAVAVLTGKDDPPRRELLPIKREVRVPFENMPRSIQLYLVGPEDNVIDFFEETSNWCSGAHRVLYVNRKPSESVLREIRNCEGDKVEFKPFIVPNDKKSREILASVMAFANTSGGTIFFGVNKNAEIEGIDADLARQSKQSRYRSSDYIKWLRTYIGENLNRTPDCEFREVKRGGRTILIVRVSEGPHKPYINVQTKETFIRRGANNIRPDPETELPSLVNAGLTL